jgi:hypothetical protein
MALWLPIGQYISYVPAFERSMFRLADLPGAIVSVCASPLGPSTSSA